MSDLIRHMEHIEKFSYILSVIILIKHPFKNPRKAFDAKIA
uniref:Uncharacterized protein n=1 Tax=uncultured Desulfobacterium sp. TaxID=201089 RepID=E1YIE0_9BACT|nr:unknown protein [uncultured Desulfobacterium sp.]